MKAKIKAVKKDGTGCLLVVDGKEEWKQFSKTLTDAVVDIDTWRKEIWGAEVEVTILEPYITQVVVLEKAKPTPMTPSAEKDDYWSKKFKYETEVRDAQLKIKGETDQAIAIVRTAYENKTSVDEVVKCINEAKKLFFGE